MRRSYRAPSVMLLALALLLVFRRTVGERLVGPAGPRGIMARPRVKRSARAVSARRKALPRSRGRN